MTSKNNKVRFPLWQFLNQPIGNPESPLTLNPKKFWAGYKVQYLERCWIKTYHPEERRPS